MKNYISSLIMLLLFSIVFPGNSTVQAATYSQAVKYVQDAEKVAEALKREISIEYRQKKYPKNPVSLPDMKLYNQVKINMQKAEQAIKGLRSSQKAILSKRLNDNVKIHYLRAQAYINAILSAQKTAEQTKAYKRLFSVDPISDQTSNAYFALSNEIKKLSALLNKVYDQKTRNAIANTYKAAGEKVINETKYVISAKVEIDHMKELLEHNSNRAVIQGQMDKTHRSIGNVSDARIVAKLVEKYKGLFHWTIGQRIEQPILHPTKPIIYGIDGSHTVVEYNYGTRKIRKVTFRDHPKRLYIYGNELYVALIKNDYDTYRSDFAQSGSIGIINSDTMKLVHEFPVSIDPFDLAVDQNNIYISSGSGQFMPIQSYSKKTYTKNGESSSLYEQSQIELHPTLSCIYAVTSRLIPRSFEVFPLENGGVSQSSHYSPYSPRNYRITSDLFLSPDGKYLFNGSGYVFYTTASPATDLTLAGKLVSFTDIAFNLRQNKMYLVVQPHTVSVYDYNSFLWKKYFFFSDIVQNVFYLNGRLIVITHQQAAQDATGTYTISMYNLDEHGLPILDR
jgi:hypothetical protein